MSCKTTKRRSTHLSVGLLVAASLLPFCRGVAHAQTATEGNHSLRSILPPGDFELVGHVKPRAAKEIEDSNWSIGIETLDRDYWSYDEAKSYLGPFGAKYARLQAGWAKCEPAKGQYEFAWLDDVIDDVRAQGVAPWVQLSYGNPIYEGGGEKRREGGLPLGTPEATEAWLAWVEAVVERYDDRVEAWEVWNEFNWAGIDVKDYIQFYILTAERIRSVDPDATIYACSMAGLAVSDTDRFLAALAEQGKLGLVDRITFHGYPTNPDDLYNSLPKLRQVVAKYSDQIELMQGESGSPSTHATTGALGNKHFTEIKQAKWDLRRMLGDLGHDLPSSLFLLCEFTYPQGRNTKGLLRIKADDDFRIDYAKPAYHACRNVTAIFDNSLERVTDDGLQPRISGSETPTVQYRYRHRTTGQELLVFWKRTECSDAVEATSATLEAEDVAIEDPVIVDLLTGRVWRYPEARIQKKESKMIFQEIPLVDCPIVIADVDLIRVRK